MSLDASNLSERKKNTQKVKVELSAFTCSNLTTEILEQGVKYVRRQQ